MRRPSLTQWIVIGMVAGTLLGWLAPSAAAATAPLATIFLRMIQSLIVPLLFGTLVVGIAGHGDDLRRVGRLALRSLVYFEGVTTLALVVGLVAVNLIQPGRAVVLHGAHSREIAALAATPVTLRGVLEHVVPASFFSAASSNAVLQVVFFAILFAVALTQVRGEPRRVMLAFCDSLSQVMFKFTNVVMGFAPVGIGAALAVTIGRSGVGVLGSLGLVVGTLYGALLVFVLAVLVPIVFLTGVPFRRFVQAVRQPALIAFSTASSEAALPRAMESMEALGVPARIVAFVIPTGYSFNLDGSTLYLAVASVFAAQAAGIDMPLSQQIVMMLTLMLTSKGVAAVPRAALVILSGALAAFGIPLEAVALLLGVDAIMDMARTGVNLVGNCLASVVMARWEGEFGVAPATQAAAVAAAGRFTPS